MPDLSKEALDALEKRLETWATYRSLSIGMDAQDALAAIRALRAAPVAMREEG
jgi:hypothetical protein